MTIQHGGWENAAAAYRSVINDPSGDSSYLRSYGLTSTIIDLLADTRPKNVLDVGCGDGWLFDSIHPDSGVECDVVQTIRQSRKWPFSVEDVTRLSFVDNTFDVIVASLVLIWVDDLDQACQE